MFPTDQNANGYLYPTAPEALARPTAPGWTGMPAGQNGQQTPPRGQRVGFICCPVTSREEAVATRVEAFGPAILMPDLGHGMIYYKRFNDKTALADFGVFRYVSPEEEAQQPQDAPPPIDYTSIISSFAQRLDNISGQLGQLVEYVSRPADESRTEKGASKK